MKEIARLMSEDVQFWGLIILFVAINLMGFYYIYRSRAGKGKQTTPSANGGNQELIEKLQRALRLLRESDKNLPEAEKIYSSAEKEISVLIKKANVGKQVKKLMIELERKIESAQARVEVTESRSKITEKFLMEHQDRDS
ncbi:MAG: hypothetical protein C4527_18750 [Candidatus Omnitrophota bacterium]|jgi:hypothetical protein|nr:MAG: hypothetical protein C4527_18750 [Candidatus Omnitrophota bacterium]